MAVRKISLNAAPGSIKRIGMFFKENIEIFECDYFKEIIEANVKYPLDLFLISQTFQGSIERYFVVGLALPVKSDNFKNPIVYFYGMKNNEYEKIFKLISEYQKNKSLIWTKDVK